MINGLTCRSREGAWIEIRLVYDKWVNLCGRSREGAWIEISVRAEFGNDPRVAPVRERGLKSRINRYSFYSRRRRSREGAWIEICSSVIMKSMLVSLP